VEHVAKVTAFFLYTEEKRAVEMLDRKEVFGEAAAAAG
jgi:hypothetical protein